MKPRIPLCVALLVLAFPPSAVAQFPAVPVDWFVAINGSFQATSNDFSDGATFRENAEDGRLDADYSVKGGPAFDIAGGATVWRDLGVAVGLTRFSHSTPTEVSASVPHPFFFSRHRSVTGDVGGLKRDELAVHLQARLHVQTGGRFPLGDRLQVTVFGGPSFYRVKQGVITHLTFAEQYPYDVASLGQAVTTSARESSVGYNVGGDVAYFFTRQLGVGFTAQQSGATIAVPSPAGGTTDVNAGGFQAGGGLRVRF